MVRPHFHVSMATQHSTKVASLLYHLRKNVERLFLQILYDMSGSQTVNLTEELEEHAIRNTFQFHPIIHSDPFSSNQFGFH